MYQCPDCYQRLVIFSLAHQPNESITRVIAGCLRFFTLYGAFLVKGKFPHMLLSCRVLRLAGFSGALPSILGMKAPLLGRAERSIPAARKGRAFRRAGLTAEARAER